MRKVGLDANYPVEKVGEEVRPVWRVHPPDFMASTGTAYVRINFLQNQKMNFLLGQEPSPTASGWFQVYDTIVDGLTQSGIEVYGLIGPEAVLESPGDHFLNDGENPAANAWIGRYVENFVAIVEHFKDRVKIFESFNEPDNWPPGKTTAWIHPYWFAKMLERIYRAVKLERGFDVNLVSGPLFAHDKNMATQYLRDTYKAGKEKLGWEEVRAYCGSYPLDGIGYHLYVHQGSDSTLEDIQRTYKDYLDAVSSVARQQEGVDRKIYVSEFGWRSDPGEEFQARRLEAGFEHLRKDPRVALAIYFCSQDFAEEPGKIAKFGLFGVEREKKLAYDFFVEQARLDREGPAPQEEIARLEKEARDLREQLAASQTTAARLQQDVQGLRQQTAASQKTAIQLRRQVDWLRQQLVEATTTTPVSTPPVTPPATPPVTVPRITSPPMEDITTRLPHHPVRSFESRALEQIQYLVIQHSVLPGGFPAEKIAAYLVEEKHWPGIGYHFYITSDGKIYQTNRLETVCYFAGANVQYNRQGVCICFAGDFTNEVPTATQLRSGGKLLAFLMQELELPIERIMGHKRFVATQSPGQQWDGGRKWKDMLLVEVRAAQA
jgi:hypothetical protein